MTDKHRIIDLAEYRNGRLARSGAGAAREPGAVGGRAGGHPPISSESIPLSAEFRIILTNARPFVRKGRRVSAFTLVHAPVYQRHDHEYLRRFVRHCWNGMLFRCGDHPDHPERFADGEPFRVLTKAIESLNDEDRRALAETWLKGVVFTQHVRYVADPFQLSS